MDYDNFQRSVAEFTSSLKYFAYTFTTDSAEADDLVQETLLKALQNENQFEPGTNLKGWLFTILRNLFINNYRQKSRRQMLLAKHQALSTSNGFSYNDGLSAIGMEEISKAMALLKEDIKIPFSLHHQGFKYEEIADELKLPIGTIKSRIFHARKQLRSSVYVY